MITWLKYAPDLLTPKDPTKVLQSDIKTVAHWVVQHSRRSVWRHVRRELLTNLRRHQFRLEASGTLIAPRHQIALSSLEGPAKLLQRVTKQMPANCRMWWVALHAQSIATGWCLFRTNCVREWHFPPVATYQCWCSHWDLLSPSDIYTVPSRLRCRV